MLDHSTLIASVESAAAQYTAEQSALFDAEGLKIFSDTAHAQREQDNLAALQSAAAQAITQAQTAIDDLATERARLATANPLASMSADQLAQAQAAQPFVNDDVSSLPLADLITLIRSAIQDRDKVMLFLYTRAAATRQEAEGQRNVELKQTYGGYLTPQRRQELVAFEAVVREANEALNPSQAEKIKQLDQKIASYQQAQIQARQSVLDATGQSRVRVTF